MQAPVSAMLSPMATSPRQPAGASIVSALPTRRRCRAAWTSTMRPTPLTMPVNMRRLSSPARSRGVAEVSAALHRQAAMDARAAIGRRLRSAGRAAAAAGAVGADGSMLVNVTPGPRRGARSARARPGRGRCRPGAARRRPATRRPASREQRAVQLLAGLDVQLVDAAPAQVGEHRARRSTLPLGRGQQRDLGAAGPSSARRRSASSTAA